MSAKVRARDERVGDGEGVRSERRARLRSHGTCLSHPGAEGSVNETGDPRAALGSTSRGERCEMLGPSSGCPAERSEKTLRSRRGPEFTSLRRRPGGERAGGVESTGGVTFVHASCGTRRPSGRPGLAAGTTARCRAGASGHDEERPRTSRTPGCRARLHITVGRLKTPASARWGPFRSSGRVSWNETRQPGVPPLIDGTKRLRIRAT